MDHINILLPDYLRGTLGDEEKAGVEAHLRACPTCQAELIEVQETLAGIQRAGTDEVPPSYFSSILPRVHQRLDRRKRFWWRSNPILAKLVLPLGVAVIAFILISRIPFPVGTSTGEEPLLAAVDSATSDDIAEIVQENIPSQDWSSFNTAIISHVLTDNRFVQRELVQEALASETTSPFNVFPDVSPQQVLGDFDEAETNELLQRLGHKETL